MMAAEPILLAEELARRVGSRSVVRVERLALYPGQIVGIAGGIGSGKSALMQMLALLEPPSEGRIHFRGRPVTVHGRSAAEARRRITLVMQWPEFFRGSLYANVVGPMRWRGISDSEQRRRAAHALRAVGLRGRERHSAAQLPIGDARRLALARALVLAPHVLLLDEPFTAGDAVHRRLVRETLHQARRELQAAILLTTLEPEELLPVADQIYFLQNGRLFEYALPGKDIVTRS
jgi:ABC-type sulfate/molybdate transport systems ATPase subunit